MFTVCFRNQFTDPDLTWSHRNWDKAERLIKRYRKKEGSKAEQKVMLEKINALSLHPDWVWFQAC